MIIWGSEAKEHQVGSGTFFCPHCIAESTYTRLRVSRYFTLYFIPLFQTSKVAEYVRCGPCRGQFSDLILTCSREDILNAVEPWACPRCGNRNPRSQRRCLACGAALAQPPPVPGLRPPPVPSGLASRPPPLPLRPPGRKKSRTLAIGLTAAAILVAVLLLPFIIGFVGGGVERQRGTQASTPAGAFYRASSQIGPRGKAASGNSAAAVDLAEQMAAAMTFVRNRGFTQSESKSLLDQHDTFKVYCDLRSDQCVFLIHIPELRRFEADAQRSLGDLAWVAAQELLAHNRGANRSMRLAIGIRGNIAYDRVLLGTFTPGLDEAARPGPGVEQGFGCEKHLFAWFALAPTNALPIVETEAQQSVPGSASQ